MPQHRNTAAALSILAMGLGQLYNRQYLKGLLMLGIHVLGLYTAVTKLPRAVWGIATLGEQPSRLVKVGKVYQMVQGDHSIFLLVEGLIVLFVLLIWLCSYAASARDAYRIGRLREEGRKPNTFAETVKYLADRRFPQLVISLPLVFVFFFTVLPIVFMILLAFTNFSSPKHVPPANLVDWVGLQSFKEIFELQAWSRTFFGVALWTLIWAVCATVTTFFGGFAVALLVQQQGIRFKTFWRTLFMIPFAIPQFVSLLIMRNMFNGQFGPVNQYLSYFGLGKLPWLSDPFWAKVTLIVVNTWIGFPVSMLMIVGILATIPKDMYEAAEIDGANGFQKFAAITFPSVMYSMAPLLVMAFAGNINNFNIIYLMTNGQPANAEYQFAGHTDILITWLYNLSLNNGKYNFASVIGIFIFIIVASFSIWNIRRTKAFREEDVY